MKVERKFAEVDQRNVFQLFLFFKENINNNQYSPYFTVILINFIFIVNSSVRVNGTFRDVFVVQVELHQDTVLNLLSPKPNKIATHIKTIRRLLFDHFVGLTLKGISSLLFIIALEALSREIRSGPPEYLLYVDDVTLVSETLEGSENDIRNLERSFGVKRVENKCRDNKNDD